MTGTSSRRPRGGANCTPYGRAAPRAAAKRALCLAALLAITVAVDARACNIPVFRYAIERWSPDPYEIVIEHRGPLSDIDKKLVALLEHYADKDVPSPLATSYDPRTANLSVRVSDKGQRDTPWLTVRYPESSGNDATAWSVPLTAENVARLVDSPARREIARRLLSGDSAVWLLLESGDRAKDEAALALLTKQLDHLQQTLELPKLTTAPRDKLLYENAPRLRIAFSVLSVPRTDAAEAAFLGMLLNLEEDLPKRADPMAFALFGRGRTLEPLIGGGINTDNIEAAAQYIIGACSCEVKLQNPGVELLFTEDWEGGLEGRLSRPPLPSFADLMPPPPPQPAAEADSGIGALVRNVLLAIVGGVIAIALLTWWAWDKRRLPS